MYINKLSNADTDSASGNSFTTNTNNASYFSNLMSSGISSSKSPLAVAQEANRIGIESTMDTIMSRVVDHKNSMILESRGNSAKKAAEISKEISF